MPTGKTKDAGWQIGVSRTVGAPVERVWRLLTSNAGMQIWLGTGVHLPTRKGAAYETAEGTRGDIRSYRPHDRVRLSWQPADREAPSTVQIALQAKGDKTTIVFHQERLADATERERQRGHWTRVLDRLVAELG